MLEQPLDCVFVAGNVALDQHVAGAGIAQGLHLARMQQGREASVGGPEVRMVVCANHAAASGEHQRLDHAGEGHLAGNQRARVVDREGGEPRHRETGGPEPLA
jgi:hypothetical protein